MRSLMIDARKHQKDRYADWCGAGKLHYTEIAGESQKITSGFPENNLRHCSDCD